GAGRNQFTPMVYPFVGPAGDVYQYIVFIIVISGPDGKTQIVTDQWTDFPAFDRYDQFLAAGGERFRFFGQRKQVTFVVIIKTTVAAHPYEPVVMVCSFFNNQ